jgi:hypothetical protein
MAVGAVLLTTAQAAFSQSLSPAWALSTISGNGTNADTGDNGPAAGAEIGKPYQAVMDKAGNLYFSEATNVIRKISPDGTISTFAGISGQSGYAGDGGPATSALLNAPYGLAIDRDGNVLIADEGNEVIRKVDRNGIISTIAGTQGKTGYDGDGGPATSALLHTPYGVGADRFGNVYIADYANHVVRKVDTSGMISTFAGTGTSGTSGDGGPAAAAELTSPFGVWADVGGNLYVTDYGANVIRMIDTAGNIHTLAGTAGKSGSTGDGGPALSAELKSPRNALSDNLGNLYIADENNHVIRWVDSNGIIETIAGTIGKSGHQGDGGPAAQGGLDFPYGLAIDANNNLYIADASNYRVRRISLNTALPATAVGSSSTQNLFVQSSAEVTPSSAVMTPAAPAEFTLGALSGCSLGSSLAANTPCTVPINFQPTVPGVQTAQLTLTDADGSVSTIGLSGMGIAPAVTFSQAAISTIAGDGSAGNTGDSGPAASAEVSAPRGGAIDSAGDIYFADSGNNVIRRIDAATGAITTVAGNSAAGYSGDGAAATSAQLNAPAKVALDAAGDLYIADTGNNVIRYVDAGTGLISTIAGTGTASYTGDSGAAASATLNHPQGLAVDLVGHVYVADTGNHAVRIFGRGGVIATLTGTGTPGYSGDGGNAYGAELDAPEAVALDQNGDLYIADTGNDVVRKVSATGQISTIAGQHKQAANTGDGGPAAAAALDQPSDLALDAAGDLYLAAGGQIRMIDTAGLITTLAGTGAAGNYSGEGEKATGAILPAPVSNLMLDSIGNIVLADTAANRLLKIASATPMPLNFGIQAPGTTGAATTFSIRNTGNSALSLSGLAVTAGFILQTGDSSACTTATSLAPGQSCSIGIVFSPDSNASGSVTGTLTLTDNALNGTSVTQNFFLSGSTRVVSDTATSVSISPASPVYGASATITAVVTKGSAPSGTVNFTINGTSIGSVPLSGNQATIQLPVLPAGVVTIGAKYSGDTGNNSSASTASITIQPAVLTIIATSATMGQGTPLPTFTYTITGFVNGDAASVVTGSPAETTTATSSSPQGTYPINIAQGTLAASNYAFTFVNGTLTIGPPPAPDFSLSVTPVEATTPAGSPYIATLTLTPIYGYKGTVQISCTSAPEGLGCSPTAALIADGSANPHGQGSPAWTQVRIFAAGKNLSQAANDPAMRLKTLWLAMVMPLFGFGTIFRKGRRNRRWLGTALSLVFLATLTAGVTSCSGGSGSKAAPGTYKVVITAADSSASLSHSATMTLTFQ